MTNTPSTIERVVMRRVRLIRILTLVISTATLATLTALASLWGIGREVWVARVFENSPGSFSDLPLFLLEAFTHTELVVQILVILTFFSLFWLLFEVAKLVVSALASIES